MATVNEALSQNDIKLICYGTIMITGPDYPDEFSNSFLDPISFTQIGVHTFNNSPGLKYVWGSFEGIEYGFSLKQDGAYPAATQSVWIHSKEAGDKNASASGVRLDIRFDFAYREANGQMAEASWTFFNVDPVEADVVDFTVPAKRNGRKPVALAMRVRRAA